MGFPLDEFDSADDAALRPKPLAVQGEFPSIAVLCFFPEAIEDLHQREHLVRVGKFSDQVGGAGIFVTPSRDVAVFHPGVGGPLSAHCLEQAIASGVQSVLAVGGAGALDESFAKDNVIVVDAAVRDEGTSYHYLPPSRKVVFDVAENLLAIRDLAELGINAREGTTWTTDADFRETRARVERRRAEGCVAVEMEAASLAAVCHFRGVRYVHLLYSGDDLHGLMWEERDWTTSNRRSQLLEAAIILSAAQQVRLQ
ncbi:nucleoside phosphorylase [Subtercola endophyticus]|uniref:nucleoside phosphorylase n=1 Tax=Subtercola endophyticus TaxID=2895559 RepID=UPI001E6366B9|nr:nucleoside phosphorylase [Subtercola endophyticus]UFS58177.1 nucleoside phosphorylase [Subtercola endophyticus]